MNVLFNVLIVDDEPAIREGLKTLIPWEDYGFKVVDVAANGKEGMERFETHSIDLVLVDVRMPKMDGLEMIEAIRRKNDAVHILVMSGYQDFKYAQTAMAWNVEGYILKPIDEEELIQFLEQIKVRLEKESEIRILVKQKEEKRKEELIQSLLSSDGHNEQVSALAGRLGLHWEHYQVLLVEIQANDDLSRNTLAIKRQLRDVLFRGDRGIVFSKDDDIGVLLKNSYYSRGSLNQLYRLIQENIGEGLVFHASIGGTVDRLLDIKKSYHTARKLLDNQFFYGDEEILSSQSTPFLNKNIIETVNVSERVLDITSTVKKLYFSLITGNKQAIESTIKDASITMIQKNFSEHEVKTNYMKIISCTTNKLSHSKVEGIQSTIPEITEKAVEVYKLPRFETLQQYVIQLFTSLVEKLDTNKTEHQLQKMIALIRQDYMENLKLETLADIFNYNQAYLGKLFKKYTGEYFNSYLDKVRIAEAKKLLLKGLKVYQVADRVGYHHVDYFHSKFKKYVGMSPSEYKRKHKDVR